MNHAQEAGDETFTRPSLSALRARLDDLIDYRMAKEMSDSRAFTNGSLRRIDEQMAEIKAEIEKRLAA